MATTLKDIAERLEISTALVSRVLNNRPEVWASEETRRRIHEAAREMNYRPSASARALVTGRTMQIAVSAADKDWLRGASGRLLEVRGLIDAAAEHRYQVLVLPSPAASAERRHFEALIHSRICDGLCLYAEQADKSLYEWLQEHALPFVIIGNPGDQSLPQVDHDNYQYFYSSVAWLREQGHERIALVEPMHTTLQQPFVQTLRHGYRDAMNTLCGGYDPALSPGTHLASEEIIAFMRGGAAPTAVLLRGLACTLQWKSTLQRHGLRLPADATVLAHLDVTELSYLRDGELLEGLACHIHDPRQVGRRAAEALMESINGHPAVEPILIAPSAPDWCGKNARAGQSVA
jgi:LacI family transcriptional regulator